MTSPLRPERVIIEVRQIKNPAINLVTDTFALWSTTVDTDVNNVPYLIDEAREDLSVNFFCVFPCKTCNLSEPTQCYSCYYSTTDYRFLFENQCYEKCPAG